MPGPQIKDWDKYHAIRKENPDMSKESASKIANAAGRRLKAMSKTSRGLSSVRPPKK